MPLYSEDVTHAEAQLDITSQNYGDDDEPGVPSRVAPSLPSHVLALTAQPGDNPGAPDAAEFTLIHADRAATKSYRASNGKPEKTSEAGVSSATAYRSRLRGDTPLTALREALEVLPAEVVLACGAMTAHGDITPMTTAARLAATPGAITRTGNWAIYKEGLPGLAALDHDAKDLPDELRARLKAAGGLQAVLASVCPEFIRAGLYARPSVSTGIRCKSTGLETAGGSLHLFFIAKDGADIKDFVRRLDKRLIRAGWGWVFIAKTGKPSVRSLIDTSASGDPGRLVFEANGVLEDEDLEHVAGARNGTVSQDGVLFDTRTLLDLSPVELDTLAAEERSLLDDAASEIASVQAQWKTEREAQLIGAGMSPAQARVRAAKALDSQRLDSATVLYLDDGQTPTVAEILRDPWSFNGKTGSDPLEPEYGGGKNKAQLRVNGQQVRYKSQAHGGQLFDLVWAADDLVDAWNAHREPLEIAEMWWHVPGDERAATEEALALVGAPSPGAVGLGMEGLDQITDLVEQGKFEELGNLKASLRGAFEDRLALAAAGDAFDTALVTDKIEDARKAAVTLNAPAPAVSAPAWTKHIALDRGNAPKPTLTNARLGLGVGCGLNDHLWLDLTTGTLVLRGVLQGSVGWAALGLDGTLPLYSDPLTGVAVFEWTDAMLTNARGFLDAWDLRISKDTGRDVVAAIAARNSFSSVGTYLRGLVWDGIPRLDRWLVRNAGAEDTSFNNVAFAKWAIAAVARALYPEERGDAAKVDTILTLIGAQDGGKSAFFRLLCAVPLWHTESSLGDISSKDAVIRIKSAWIVDMSEGSSIKANEVEAFKQFVTVLADSVRLPYASTTTRHPRRCIFGMNVNPDGTGFAKDPTGNRRIWAVEVEDIDMGLLVRERDQLWAEAVHRFDAREKWYFDKRDAADAAVMAEAAAAVEEHRSRTPIEEAIRQYVGEAPTLDLRGRVSWKPRTQPLSVICAVHDVLADMGFPVSTASFRDAERGLRAAGWVKTRMKFRGTAVKRDARAWVSPAGVDCLKRDKRSRGPAGAFKRWLEEEHSAGRVHASAGGEVDTETPASGFADTPK